MFEKLGQDRIGQCVRHVMLCTLVRGGTVCGDFYAGGKGKERRCMKGSPAAVCLSTGL